MDHPLAINFIRRHFVLDDQWTEAADGPKTYVGVIKIRPCGSIGHMKFIVEEMLEVWTMTGEGVPSENE